MVKYAISLVVLLLTLPFLCGTEKTLPAADENRDPIPTPPHTDVVQLSSLSQELAEIEVEQVKPQSIQSALKAMGKVLAPKPQTAIVGHAFPARVAKIDIEIGDWVEKGQTLVTLESQEVGSAKSDFFKTVADLELAKLNFEREQRLLDEEIGIEKNLRMAEAEHKIAQANHEAAEKRLHVLGFTEDQVREIADTHQISPSIVLFAPIAGKIINNNAILGQLVDQTTEIMTIIDPTLLWVDAQIYEKDIAKISIGQTVEIVVPAYPSKIFQGAVSYIGDIVDEETHTITVRAEVANPKQLLKPGMFANVNIILDADDRAPAVPESAVLEDGHQKFVFVKQGDSFLRREIETGICDRGYVEVRGGLEVGDQVVIRGNYQLKSEMDEELLHHGHHH